MVNIKLRAKTVFIYDPRSARFPFSKSTWEVIIFVWLITTTWATGVSSNRVTPSEPDLTPDKIHPGFINQTNMIPSQFHSQGKKCRSNASAPKDDDYAVYSKDFIREMKLWPHLFDGHAMKHGKTLVNSKEALEIIWKSQNPTDCKSAKYLLSPGYNIGFGGRFHVER